MRGAALAALGSLLLAAGCATTVDVAYDEGEDFSRFRTWSWWPPESRTTPVGGRLALLVAEGLAERGYLHDPLDPDLRVIPYLRVRRQRVEVHTTPAMQHLSSMHESASYDVQATTREVQEYETAFLAIVLSDAREPRVVWRGELRGRYSRAFSPHLEGAVADLLGRLPRPHPPEAGAGTP